MYLLVKHGNMTYDQIGKVLGGKHHTTIIHGYEKIFQELENNNAFICSALSNLNKRIEGKI